MRFDNRTEKANTFSDISQMNLSRMQPKSKFGRQITAYVRNCVQQLILGTSHDVEIIDITTIMPKFQDTLHIIIKT